MPPARLRATAGLPWSKSVANRMLIIGALAGVETPDDVAATCDDTRAASRALASTDETVDIGAAGTAMRFLTAYLASRPGRHTLTGTERMRHRPIAILVDALRRLGADIAYAGEAGFPPLDIRGRRLRGGELTMEAGVSSQYISALLMIAPTMERGLTLRLTGHIASRPYIDMTLALMRRYGAEARWTADDTITAGGRYRPAPYYIEADWSAASYWYEMMALTADTEARVLLPGLHADSLQGDSAVRRMFEPLGVKTTFTPEGALLTRQPITVQRLDLDLSATPDLAQTLTVTLALLGLPFRLTGVESLRIKETDRTAALTRELAKLGCNIEGSTEAITGVRNAGEPPALPAIDTYDDHRMALAFAPACLRTGRIVINNAEVVSKSYPTYWDDLARAQFTIQR